MNSIRRVAVTSLVAGAALLATAAPAIASDDRPVTVVDEPDTSGLNNKWTFAPLGVPVFGLVDSVAGVPGKLH